MTTQKRKTPSRGVNSGQKKAPRPRWKRILLWLSLLAVVGGLCGVAVVVGVFIYYGSDPNLPNPASLHDYRPKAVTRIFDRQGVLIAEIGGERRTPVPYSRLPKLLVKAVVASEDAEFFKHGGLDYMGMLRAFLTNLRAGGFRQGGSTITQQVVKTVLLSPERTIRRKVQEVILARRLETELSKEEILHVYLNTIYLGHGRYGVEEASRFLFGVSVDKLDVGQIALLAGLPQSPERLSPLKHPVRAKQRQVYVLKMMAKEGFISADEAQRLAREPIRVMRSERPHYNEAPEFAAEVQRELGKQLGAQQLESEGRSISTTLDAKLQQAAREALEWGLRAIDARQGFRRRLVHLKGQKIERKRKELARTQRRLTIGRIYQGIVTSVDDATLALKVDLGGVGGGTVDLSENGRYNPTGLVPSKRFEPGDVIAVRAVGKDLFVFDGGPQAALVALDPRTGEVLAMVGGYDYARGGFNHALRAWRSPGSAFKPFVYAAALATKRYTPATIVEDAPVSIGGYQPKNFDGVFRGNIRLREALAHSINTVAVRLVDDVGQGAVRDLARTMGIRFSRPEALSGAAGDESVDEPVRQKRQDKAEENEGLSLALGTAEVTPMELALAYATLANGGNRISPLYVRKLGASEVQPAKPQQVIDPALAFVTTSMMESVVKEGTARLALRLRRPVAGKTGTTNRGCDAWFAGFTPQLVAVVWVGFEGLRPLGRGETGGQAALPIWVRFVGQALAGKPTLPFAQPANVTVERIDPKSGLLAADGATDALQEVFIAGTEPKERAVKPDQVDPNTILMNPELP